MPLICKLHNQIVPLSFVIIIYCTPVNTAINFCKFCMCYGLEAEVTINHLYCIVLCFISRRKKKQTPEPQTPSMVSLHFRSLIIEVTFSLFTGQGGLFLFQTD